MPCPGHGDSEGVPQQGGGATVDPGRGCRIGGLGPLGGVGCLHGRVRRRPAVGTAPLPGATLRGVPFGAARLQHALLYGSVPRTYLIHSRVIGEERNIVWLTNPDYVNQTQIKMELTEKGQYHLCKNLFREKDLTNL